MIIYAVCTVRIHNDEVKYQVLPYSLWGTILFHFKFRRGLFSLIPFLKTCRLTEKGAMKLEKKFSKVKKICIDDI